MSLASLGGFPRSGSDDFLMTQSPFKLLPLYWVLKCVRFLHSPFIYLYIFKRYLFIWLCFFIAGSSFVVVRRLSVACGLWSVQAQWLWHIGPLVVAHRLTCSTACRILVPQLGIEPAFTALQGRLSTFGPPENSLHFSFKSRVSVSYSLLAISYTVPASFQSQCLGLIFPV